MAKTKKKDTAKREAAPHKPAVAQPITETIEKNYMPYVMSVIVSRAIPEIDGFKPSQRKLLYMMYKMGLLTGARTKSTNVVGQTMKLNPHGDAAIYETMVRLTRGNEALLHPFIDSKGTFGKQYSRDMAYAASRYTEVKLDSFCSELFRGIDKNAVDLVPNYDNQMTEPVLLPTTFPNVLVSPNTGIAVGMASSICSFNLGEICDATIAMLRNPRTNTEKILDLVPAPDFSGGAFVVYDREKMREVYDSGRGAVKLRARYVYDKSENCIEIIEIPYSTSIEAIMKKLTDLVKENKLKEVSDFRDEIDLNGFKLTIDLRKGVDPDKFMAKLYKLTPLEDSFDCNFNILIDGAPRQMGICEILREWIRFRMGCLSREMTYDLQKKKDKLHLLLGLGKILLDIDKAIAIVRGTAEESMVVPNLMKAFSIDEIQAEYIAEIKLRHLNQEYILNRLKEITDLQAEIAELEQILADELKIKACIVDQLKEIKKKHAKPRKTNIIYAEDIADSEPISFVENYNVKLVFTKDGYFKKITLASLRGNDVQGLKEGDSIVNMADADNLTELIFFTNQCQLYNSKVSDFDTCKASALGEFVAAKLKMDDGERPILMIINKDISDEDNMVFIFENGKGVRIPMSAYKTKSARRKLTGAYSDASPIVSAIYQKKPSNILIVSDTSKAIMINTKLIPEKSTRTSVGVQIFTLKGKQRIAAVHTELDDSFGQDESYKKIKIPAIGVALTSKDKKILNG